MKSYSSTTSTHLQTPPVTCRITRSGITAAPEWGTQGENAPKCPHHLGQTQPSSPPAVTLGAKPALETHCLPGPRGHPRAPGPGCLPWAPPAPRGGDKLLTLRDGQVPDSLRPSQGPPPESTGDTLSPPNPSPLECPESPPKYTATWRTSSPPLAFGVGAPR